MPRFPLVSPHRRFGSGRIQGASGGSGAPAPDGFDYWRSDEIIPAVVGPTESSGFDHWRADELIPALAMADTE